MGVGVEVRVEEAHILGAGEIEDREPSVARATALLGAALERRRVEVDGEHGVRARGL